MRGGVRTGAKDCYTVVAIILHWLIALAIIALLVLGLTMTSMPTGMDQFRLYQLHKSIGITVLGLSLIRLMWRLTHVPPPLPVDMPRWQKITGRFTHWSFYALMIGMPLTGWAIVSTSPMNLPIVLFGVVTLPHLPLLGDLPHKKETSHLFASVHSAGAWIMIALLGLHIAAALFHQFIRRDDVVHHMLPFLKAHGNRKGNT